MRYLIVCFLLIGCSKNDDKNQINSKDTFYKIISFNITDNPIDIDNNGVLSTDILSELTNYSYYPYDLEIKNNNDKKLFSFYLPTQNIDINNFVEFSRNGFTYELEGENLNNVEIDSNNFIIRLEKTTSFRYKLVLKKKYYDFSINAFNNFEFDIVFEEV
ncbi:MAG: hypothetical protein ACK5MZ_11195 [Aestuariibaculum sp.]